MPPGRTANGVLSCPRPYARRGPARVVVDATGRWVCHLRVGRALRCCRSTHTSHFHPRRPRLSSTTEPTEREKVGELTWRRVVESGSRSQGATKKGVEGSGLGEATGVSALKSCFRYERRSECSRGGERWWRATNGERREEEERMEESVWCVRSTFGFHHAVSKSRLPGVLRFPRRLDRRREHPPDGTGLVQARHLSSSVTIAVHLDCQSDQRPSTTWLASASRTAF